jgi:hypothetical protein
MKIYILGWLLISALLLLILAQEAKGSGIKDLYFGAESFVGTQYEPYISSELPENEQLTYRILTGYKYIGYRTGKFSTFWNLEVDGVATTKQFRYTALTTSIGVCIDKIELFYYHKSEHMLEYSPREHFPLRNTLGIRWHLIDNKGR